MKSTNSPTPTSNTVSPHKLHIQSLLQITLKCIQTQSSDNSSLMLSFIQSILSIPLISTFFNISIIQLFREHSYQLFIQLLTTVKQNIENMDQTILYGISKQIWLLGNLFTISSHILFPSTSISEWIFSIRPSILIQYMDTMVICLQHAGDASKLTTDGKVNKYILIMK
jgi:hypothetical protein